MEYFQLVEEFSICDGCSTAIAVVGYRFEGLAEAAALPDALTTLV
jgi:hypothetical protein